MSFWSKLGSSIGSAIFNNNIGSGLMSFFGFENAADERLAEQQYNSMEADKNREFQRMMWQANNAYNSPENQLKRLMRAGINPNAMFGGSNPSVASSAPSGSQAAPTPSIANSLLLHDAQVANLMAQADKTKSDADLNKLQLTYDELTFGQRVQSLELANRETRQRIDNLIQDKEIQRKTFDFFSLKSSAELKALSEQLNVLRSQYLLNMKSVDKIDQDINESQARVDLMGEQTESQDIQNQLKSVELEFCNITGLPFGTPVEERLFYLYKTGRFDDVMYTYMATAENAYSRSWTSQANVLLNKGAAAVNNLFKGAGNGISESFSSPFWKEVKKGSKQAFTKFFRSSPYSNSIFNRGSIYNP